MDLADIDLCDPDNFVDGVPYEWFAQLRKEAPVHWHPDPAASPRVLVGHPLRRLRRGQPGLRALLVGPAGALFNDLAEESSSSSG